MLGKTLDSPGADQEEPAESKRTRLNEQIADFQKAIEYNPYSTAAIYKLALTYRLSGDAGALRKWLEVWKELDGRQKGYGDGEDISPLYGDRGRYAQVINPLVERSPGPGSQRPPRFGPPTPLSVRLKDGERWVSPADFAGRLASIGRARARFGAPIAAFDADGDGNIDLFLPAAIVGRRGVRDALLLNKGQGTFEDATERLGLPLDRASLGAAAGDFDADGRIDLFLTGVGNNRLCHNEGTKGFTDETKAAGIAGPAAVSLTARWLDLDQDGDLDLYVVNYTGIEYTERAFTGQAPPGIANAVYRNDGKPSPVSGRPETDWAPSAVARYPELGTSKLSIVMNPWPGADALLGGVAPHTGIAVLDLDDDRDLGLDGSTDLLGLASSAALPIPNWARNEGTRLSAAGLPLAPDDSPSTALLGLALADLTGDGLPDLVLAGDRQAPRAARNLGKGHHWLALTLSGRWASWGRLRTNPHGIGARVWLQGPRLNTARDTSTPETGLSQSVVPIALGLGEEYSAAVLRIRWPDGVNQSELNVPGDQRLALAETTHRVSTCPILFARDGSRFQCVCDLLAGGGLGYFLGPGVVSVPDRDESVAIAPSLLQPIDGAYRLIIAEPMDEVAYLDRLTLINANAGCPAGLTRLTTLDVTGKLTGPQCVIRLRTNLECYWDQAFVAPLEAHPGTRVTPLPVGRATLGYRGYVLETSPDGHMPMLCSRSPFTMSLVDELDEPGGDFGRQPTAPALVDEPDIE
jgi:hypothetical protein